MLGAIAANLETMTGGIHREWTAGAQPYLERLARPGEHDPSFKSDKEVTSAIFETLRLGLRRVAELKLGLPLGLPRKKPKPERAESWRSSRSIRNIVVNLRALEALYFGPQSLGLAGLVEDEALDDLIRRAFAQTIATARSIEPPLAAALSNSGEHGEIEQLHKEVTALARIVETRLPSELDIILGFNAADGD